MAFITIFSFQFYFNQTIGNSNNNNNSRYVTPGKNDEVGEG